MQGFADELNNANDDVGEGEYEAPYDEDRYCDEGYSLAKQSGSLKRNNEGTGEEKKWWGEEEGVDDVLLGLGVGVFEVAVVGAEPGGVLLEVPVFPGVTKDVEGVAEEEGWDGVEGVVSDAYCGDDQGQDNEGADADGVVAVCSCDEGS